MLVRLDIDCLAFDEHRGGPAEIERVVDLLGRSAGTLLGKVGRVLRLHLGRIEDVVAEDTQERQDEGVLCRFLTSRERLAFANLVCQSAEIIEQSHASLPSGPSEMGGRHERASIHRGRLGRSGKIRAAWGDASRGREGRGA